MSPVARTVEPVVALRCPACQRALRGAAYMQAATLLCKRTCLCGARWRLKVSVLRVSHGVGAVHQVDWWPR
jgi:hypothetical protein